MGREVGGRFKREGIYVHLDNHDGVITHLEPDILECKATWALGCQQIWKTQQWPQDWKRSVFIPIPRKEMQKGKMVV